MNQLKLFDGQHEVMILLKEDVNFSFNGDFLIRAKDVATALEYQGTSATQEVLKFAKKDQVFLVKNSNMVNRHIRIHNTGETFITNLALNRIFGKSGQPKAEQFQDWLYEDVLPSIRKYGAYMTPETIEKALLNPDTIINLATQLKEEQQKRIQFEQTIQKQQPLVLFAETCLSSTNSILVREVAKLATDEGLKIGQNRLYKKLREWGYIMKHSTEPTQRALEQGYFEVIQRAIQTPEGTRTERTTKVKPKGQVRIIERLKSDQGHIKGVI